MSKLAEAVMAGPPGKRREIQATGLRFADVEDVVTRAAFLAANEYRIGVRLEATALVSDAMQAAARGDELARVIENTRRSVVEAVFGEFRAHFREIDAALWERDFETARERLHAMERCMFSTEVK